jgi:glycosyltransferase involved in cell wall biosynthesis
MRISIFSAFYPFRGGIAQFNAHLYRSLEKNNEVNAYTFKTQYPNFLFPGKTQYVTAEDQADPIPAKRIVSPFNPFTYFAAIRKIKREKPQVLIVNHWMSFFGFCFGILARFQAKETLRVALVHNLIPHEQRFFDRFLNRFFVNSFDRFVVLSENVKNDILRVKPDAVVWCKEHPWYDHFGARIEREEACETLGLNPDLKTILFFGLVRTYKGLDVLIEAFNDLGDDFQLLIAGEVYSDKLLYHELIKQNINKERIHFFDRYIADEEVTQFFSVADVCVLPYRSATQSGVTAVSFHFEVPVIVTNVGALAETVSRTGGGIVVERPERELLKSAIQAYFSDFDRNNCIEQIRNAKNANSWSLFSEELIAFLSVEN